MEPNNSAPDLRKTTAAEYVKLFARKNLWLFKQLWIWPIVAALVLAVIGVFLRVALETTMQEDLRVKLLAVLETDVTALRVWLRSQELIADGVARDSEFREQALKLVEMAADSEASKSKLLTSSEMAELRTSLKPILDGLGVTGFFVCNRDRLIIASKRDDNVWLKLSDDELQFAMDKAFEGQPRVSPPQKSTVILPDRHGKLRAGVPTMFALAPLRDDNDTIVAVLGLRIPPEEEFTKILSVARASATGETYAFDRNGLLLSGSRFDDQLRRVGLLTEDADSILNVSLRDPGVDMTEGLRPKLSRSEQPLTAMAAGATSGKTETNLHGYRDYRGVPSIGSWTWLDDYQFGVGTEVDVEDAYRPLRMTRAVFWAMFALLGAASVAIFVFSIVNARLKLAARRAALQAKQLGQYTLEQKLGEGGMGVVYRGHHAMLQRPTAIKFLHPEKTNDQTIARFEREVKLTSQLMHPNTIAIYDYGRTPEGVFYYAMEYLDGLNLEDMVNWYGPLSDGRAIHILKQICGSLAEAHGVGLIHRDIKPANIMLTMRGGIPDFVKVLDFGLVKALDDNKQAGLTSSGSVNGTPLYLSPEAVTSPEMVDARADLYAIGAVGYYLVTGKPVFEAKNVLEILRLHASSPPVPPSQRSGLAVSSDLEQLLLRCLAKQPADRPQSARELEAALQLCCATSQWMTTDGLRWWQQRDDSPISADLTPTGVDVGATIITGR